MQGYVSYGATGNSQCLQCTLHIFARVFPVTELQYKAVTTRPRLHAQLYICCHNSTLTVFYSVDDLTLRHSSKRAAETCAPDQ